MAFVRNHKMESSDEHYTPKMLFDLLNLEFDMDVCAPTGGVPWIPAKQSFDLEMNGLSQNWDGLVWMNPPFSKPGIWVEKFISHGNGIALCVVSRSNWFNQLWNECDGMLPFPRQWKFERPDGSSKQISFQSMLFAMGDVSYQALLNTNLGRVR